MSVAACNFGISRERPIGALRLAVGDGTRTSVRGSFFPVPIDSQHGPLSESLPSRRGGDPLHQGSIHRCTLHPARFGTNRGGQLEHVCSSICEATGRGGVQLEQSSEAGLGAFERAAALHVLLAPSARGPASGRPFMEPAAPAAPLPPPGRTPSLSVKGATRRLRRCGYAAPLTLSLSGRAPRRQSAGSACRSPKRGRVPPAPVVRWSVIMWKGYRPSCC